MSLFAAKRLQKLPKIRYSYYIRTENTPAEESKSPPKPPEAPKPSAQ